MKWAPRIGRHSAYSMAWPSPSSVLTYAGWRCGVVLAVREAIRPARARSLRTGHGRQGIIIWIAPGFEQWYQAVGQAQVIGLQPAIPAAELACGMIDADEAWAARFLLVNRKARLRASYEIAGSYNTQCLATGAAQFAGYGS